MKAAYINEFADKGNLQVGELPDPVPEDNEVRIEVAYAGVNPADGKVAQGLFESRVPHQFPLILGWEASGIVIETGKKVTLCKVGDRVFTYCRKPILQHGTWAEFVCVREEHVARIPDCLSFEQAAAVPLASLTAWQALFEKIRLQGKEVILIHAGAGGVGGYAIQLAKLKDAQVITTASAAKGDYVRELGADEVIDYQQTSFVEAVLKMHSHGIDAVFDTVGGDIYQKSFDVLKEGGSIVSILMQPDANLAKKRHNRTEYLFVYPDGKSLGEIGSLFEQKKIKVPPIAVFDLSRSSEALEKIRTGRTTGKIVLRVRP